MMDITSLIDAESISSIIEEALPPTSGELSKILTKAELKKGLTLGEAASLLKVTEDESVEEIRKSAGRVKRDIYGERLVLFAPLYTSSYCVNDCAYCGYRSTNKIERRRLTTEVIKSEAKALIDMGHKRVLLECGEDPELNTIDYTVEAIQTIYSVKSGSGEIRRINVNMAAAGVEEYRRLKASAIGTYQLFQETYHRPTYERLHSGPKGDYARQLFAHDRAFEAGIDDVGLGVLFGLYDYRFEVLALLSHAHYLESTFGVGPHTLSVPRFKPALGAEIDTKFAVTDDELLNIIAVLRLALPYTGMIISTRESPELRLKALEIGISQASACSSASPGGYTNKDGAEQFTIGDERGMDDFLREALKNNLLPSFCTACYRNGRTGEVFMELAKPGEIQHLCKPNALLTFKEYLEDYAATDVKRDGAKVIEKYLAEIKNPRLREETRERLKRIEGGERDSFI
ncbi:MAG: [FeFe] hydrogenase H-cluster radical SAM maturase HydG [Proteobacteria bacterium]|nr:[FeFe] hydrogenase H-cluster radical SAM maturase HydG [Pseudomonadota bacterium]